MRTVEEAQPTDRRDAAEAERPARGAWLVWGVGALCYLIALFHRASMGVAAPEALQRFSAGPALLSVFSALQLGVYLVLQVPSGVLADRLGPRRVITGGVLALALGSAVFAVTGSAIGGITGRVLIGFGDAFMFTNVLRLAAHWFPAGKYGKVAALTGLAGGVGQLFSTMPLTAALHGLGWTPTFLAAAVITALLAVAAGSVIRDRPAGAVAHHDEAEDAHGVLRTLRVVIAQRGTKHGFWVHFVLMAQFLALTTLWGSPWLTEAEGHSKADAGSWLLLCVVGFIASSWFAGQYVAGRARRRERFTLGLSVAVVLAWAVVVLYPAALPTPLLVAVLLVIGVGGGGAMLAFDSARSANPAHRSGTASGVVNMGGFGAGVLVQLLVGTVLQVVSGLSPVQSYQWAFVPLLVLLLIGTVLQVVRSRPRAA